MHPGSIAAIDGLAGRFEHWWRDRHGAVQLHLQFAIATPLPDPL